MASLWGPGRRTHPGRAACAAVPAQCIDGLARDPGPFSRSHDAAKRKLDELGWPREHRMLRLGKSIIQIQAQRSYVHGVARATGSTIPQHRNKVS